jgi:hypothetical protein
MNPYLCPEMKEQFTVGDAPASVAEAYVLWMSQLQGPPLFFVKDIRYRPPKEYWSAVQAMAKRFGHYYLAVDFARYLEKKPDTPNAIIKIKPIVHRETVSVQTMRHSLSDILEVPRDPKGFLAWISTYKGVMGEKHLQTPDEVKVFRPQSENEVAAEVVRRYAKLIKSYSGAKGVGREFLGDGK